MPTENAQDIGRDLGQRSVGSVDEFFRKGQGTRHTARDGDAEFSGQTSDHVDHLGALPHQEIATTVQAQERLLVLHNRLQWFEIKMRLEASKSRQTKLLQTIPGVGPVTASAVAATIGSGQQFRNGREFAAWLGLTPRNHSSGGKERLGKITKMGDRYLRQLIVVGMTSRVRQVVNHPDRADPWLADLLQRKPARLATVAMANKTARIMWAVLTRNEQYRPRTA